MTPNGKPSRKLKIPCANNTCGFDPHHRHKKAPPACLGEFSFYLRRVRGSNSTALPCRASDQPCGLSLSARETPTTGIKKLLQLVWGSFLFYLRRMSGSNSTARISDKEHHGLGVHIKTEKQKLPRKNTVRQLLLFICRVPPRVPTVPFHLIPLPQRGVFARCICGCSAARLFREGLSVLPKRRTLARKKRRNAVPTIYSAVSYRFYNVFYKKDFTNEF